MGTYVCPNCGTEVEMNAFVKRGNCPNCGCLLQLGMVDSYKETKQTTEAVTNVVFKVLKIIGLFLIAPFICILLGIFALIKKNTAWGITYLVVGVISSVTLLYGAITQGNSNLELPTFLIYVFGISWIASMVIVYKIFVQKTNDE